MKDPAFLFYSQDFIVGTLTMSFEDRGKYITILSLMHQQGRMDEKTISLLVGSVSVNLKSKFIIDENGFWYNKRLELETEKRNKFIESRINNGKQGGRPKLEKKPSAKPSAKPKKNLIEDVNEYEYIDVRYKSIILEWLKYKKDRKENYKSETSIIKFLNQLKEYSNDNPIIAQKIIDNSIANNWAGIFKLKEEFEKKSTFTPSPR